MGLSLGQNKETVLPKESSLHSVSVMAELSVVFRTRKGGSGGKFCSGK